MRRLLLLILILAAIVALDPRLRAWIVPHLDPVVQPLHEREARHEIDEIRRRLEARLAAGGSLPEPRQFTAYLQRVGIDSTAAYDPWGNPYRLEIADHIALVISSGRDGIPDTEHDIRSEPLDVRLR
jgi:hypothetical protein